MSPDHSSHGPGGEVSHPEHPGYRPAFFICLVLAAAYLALAFTGVVGH